MNIHLAQKVPLKSQPARHNEQMNEGPPSSILAAAAGDRRPAIGSIVCPWCGQGDLYWSVDSRELWSVNCTEAFCQHLNQRPLNALPNFAQNWMQLSAPSEAA